MPRIACDIFCLDPRWLAGQTGATALLAAEEQTRLKRFRVESARLEYLAGRVLLRSVIGKKLDLLPEAVPLAISPHGKPYLPGSPWQFSLSHTSGCVALALCEHHCIGVDVERWDRRVRPGLASRFFSHSECAQLAALGETPARDHYFLRLWTAKEAWWKAFDPEPGFDMTRLTLRVSPWQLLDPHHAPQGSLCLIEEPEHVLALASTTVGQPLAPVIHRWSARDVQRVLE